MCVAELHRTYCALTLGKMFNNIFMIQSIKYIHSTAACPIEVIVTFEILFQ